MAQFWYVRSTVGWGNIKNNIFILDAIKDRLTWMTSAPVDLAGWIRTPINSKANALAFDLPAGAGAVAIDTGSPLGVCLTSSKWNEWRTAHPAAPTTLDATVTLGSGLVIEDQCWAQELALGPLTMTDVPVQRANVTQENSVPNSPYLATLGLAALKRLEIIVDGKGGWVYLRPQKSPALSFLHNRLGAVFWLPNDKGSEIVARVAVGTPAYLAGIRDGDMLVKVGSQDMTKLRNNPLTDNMSRIWLQPSGTKLELTLRRSGKDFHTTVILRNILSPDSAAHR